jgi:uncharacterized membrane protein YgcG
MQGVQPKGLTPPGNLRPAQLGIVLVGRVVLGHVTATLVDLSQRGFLRIEEIDGQADPSWLLTDLRDQAADSNPLLRFEVTLLDGLFSQQPSVRLSEIDEALVAVLDRFRTQLARDAVRNGRLRRWHRTRRQSRGEQLLTQIRDFRCALRALAASASTDALAGLVPYAMIFGLWPRSGITISDDHEAATAHRRATEMPWSQTDAFVMGWLEFCASLPGHGHRSNFIQEWSAPHDHGHGGHDSGHSGHNGSEYHGGGGHHGGGFHGGDGHYGGGFHGG